MSLWLGALLLGAEPVLESPAFNVEKLDSITAELEAQKDWNEVSRVRAEAVAKLRFDNWGICLRNSKTRLRRSTEAVETVATAIIGSCLREEQEYRRALTISYRGKFNPMERAELAEHAISNGRAKSREAFISQLVTERLAP